jgi:hypothetical protein
MPALGTDRKRLRKRDFCRSAGRSAPGGGQPTLTRGRPDRRKVRPISLLRASAAVAPRNRERRPAARRSYSPEKRLSQPSMSFSRSGLSLDVAGATRRRAAGTGGVAPRASAFHSWARRTDAPRVFAYE